MWRHGQTTWNADRRVQGQEDVALSTVGRAQAEEAAGRLAELHPVSIVSSDLGRAAATAQALARLTGLDVRYDERLRERYYGPWQGCPITQIEERWPVEFARWQAGQSDLGLGIEPLETLAKRTATALAEAFFAALPETSVADLAPRGQVSARVPQDAASVIPQGAVVVVVTHGGAARLGCATLLGWPDSVLRTLRVLGNCRWTELHHTEIRGWQLWSHNA